jgi:hypothetical protein
MRPQWPIAITKARTFFERYQIFFMAETASFATIEIAYEKLQSIHV